MDMYNNISSELVELFRSLVEFYEEMVVNQGLIKRLIWLMKRYVSFNIEVVKEIKQCFIDCDLEQFLVEICEK